MPKYESVINPVQPFQHLVEIIFAFLYGEAIREDWFASTSYTKSITQIKIEIMCPSKM